MIISKSAIVRSRNSVIIYVIKKSMRHLRLYAKVPQDYLNFEERLPDEGLPEEGFDDKS